MINFSDRLKVCSFYDNWRSNASEDYTIDDSPLSFLTFLMRKHWIDENAVMKEISLYDLMYKEV